ncbi:hypothetical protein DFH07DRAFT_222701 [Mycena maculata]|uniref:DUF6534 domain-containing protein n=1 Tax=Mycena maculata TaxID=230809 RepID=A0AAD7HVQ8_9AGAR|nr:hypothetical protein DFH07DRAFT_222701 [Mycena maculata]
MVNREAEYLVGPYVIGTCIELVFQGILSAQFVSYFTTYRKDPLAMKVLVAILVFATYAKSIQAFTILWYQTTVNFGDLNADLDLRHGAWYASSSGLTASAIVLYVQIYFTVRFFRVSHKWYLAVPLSFIFIVGFIFQIVTCREVVLGAAYDIEVAALDNVYVVLILIGDTLLTSGLAFCLIKSRRSVSIPQTVGKLSSLIRLTFQTAAPATVCALTNFIFYLTFPEVYPLSRGLASMATNIVLPKLYAFSMMWTLNVRRDIRTAFGDDYYSTDPETGPTLEFSEYAPTDSEYGTRQRSEKRTKDASVGTGRTVTTPIQSTATGSLGT